MWRYATVKQLNLLSHVYFTRPSWLSRNALTGAMSGVPGFLLLKDRIDEIEKSGHGAPQILDSCLLLTFNGWGAGVGREGG